MLNKDEILVALNLIYSLIKIEDNPQKQRELLTFSIKLLIDLESLITINTERILEAIENDLLIIQGMISQSYLNPKFKDLELFSSIKKIEVINNINTNKINKYLADFSIL